MTRPIQAPADEASRYVGSDIQSGALAADLHRVVA
ncbi:UNVERIFIED_ORG: hypothetical protein M2438_001219 [Methylobacterium sp. SuP10 SLI 274]|nr:hypothetical protein [Methylorubrum extorquens]MDF9790723.1 hypothetical protein [Methylorubrum extorquens]MDF9862430.1 hypothetical protein [Methylorubrum pseudosasae]MDH6636044.1 hypothetical protein [Methylobacterium sp. SuP10 SLI 274]MDH6665218.1 hypothetical protein [Methylorubrum zatmanii]